MRDESGLELLSNGQRDLAFLGSDKVAELVLNGSLKEVNIVDSVEIDCSLVLAGASSSNTFERVQNGEQLAVATSYPFIFSSTIAETYPDLRLVYVKGASEGYVSSGLYPLVFDIKSSGSSLEANGLEIYTETTKMNLEVLDNCNYANRSPGDGFLYNLLALSETLAERAQQAKSSTKTTYTLELMRDQNKRIKKLGEEFSELLQALLRPVKDRNEIVSEAADLLYSIEVSLALEGISIIDLLVEDIRRNKV